MLFDPARHEALNAQPWDESLAREAIDWIVRETDAAFRPGRYWPAHPKDLDPGDDPAMRSTPLYFGAAGVVWALRHLRALGACDRTVADEIDLAALRDDNRAWLRAAGFEEFGSYLMGDLAIELMAWESEPSADRADALAWLIGSNIDHPARELMWGSPGTMLAAAFLHERTGEARWAELFRASARKLHSQLRWSREYECHYWTQELGGDESSYLDAVHGFAATASVLIRGRHLLDAGEWDEWARCIANTIARSANREGPMANWRAWLHGPRPAPYLVQFCHGAPGFVVCLGDMPGASLDELLIAAGETTWQAGPLTKGSNLCHGTGGNGYAFLKLFRRTQDAQWLERARAFAMHGVQQVEADAARYGRMRYSLWTGDPGFAVYLWDCIRGAADFPTLDVFFAARPTP